MSTMGKLGTGLFYIFGGYAIKNGFTAVVGSKRHAHGIGVEVAEIISAREKITANEFIPSESDKQSYKLTYSISRAICWASLAAYTASLMAFIFANTGDLSAAHWLLVFMSFIASTVFSMALLYRSSVNAFVSGHAFNGSKVSYRDYKSSMERSLIKTLLPMSIEEHKS